MLIDKAIPPEVLEHNWDALAHALNQVVLQKQPVFLAKLALLLAAALEDPATLPRYIEVALQDIEPERETAL